MKKKATTVKKVDLADRVIALVEEARRKVVAAANVALVYTYFEVGRMIVEDEQGGKNRAEYGKELLKDLSRKLTDRFGRGFSVDNLQNMRNLYIAYSTRKIYETPSRKSGGGKSEKRSRKFVHGSKDGKNGDLEIQKISDPFRLSWSHYLVLMRIENPEERRFYEIEAAENGWDLDELKRQFKSSLYERLALSRDKKGILALAKHGQIVSKPEDVIKDPYVLEFLGLDGKLTPHGRQMAKIRQHHADYVNYFIY